MTDQTPNFKLNLPSFDLKVWNTLINENMSIIDAVLQNYLSVQNLTGVWRNSTIYSVGQKAIDADQGVIYQCMVANTSAPAGTSFTQERINNPSYWGGITTVEKFRGVWTAGTIYSPRDFVVSGNIYAVCLTGHTSNLSGIFGNDAVYWTYLINLTGINPPPLAGNATCYLRVNAAATSLEYRTASQVYADIGIPISIAGPGASVNNAIPVWNGAQGNALSDSGISITSIARVNTVSNNFTNDCTFKTSLITRDALNLMVGTANGAAEGPILSIQRDKASGGGTTGDLVGALHLNGENLSSQAITYGGLRAKIISPSITLESGELRFATSLSGTYADRLVAGAGIYTPNASGGDKGADSINTKQLYIDGVALGTASNKNTLINGDLEVWSRGAGGAASFSVPGGATFFYVADRWWVITGAGENHTISQQPGLTNNSRYCMRIQRNAGQTGVIASAFGQTYTTDMLLPLRGKPVTVSAKVRGGANWSPAGGSLLVTLIIGTGTEQKNSNSFTGPVAVIATPVTVTAGVTTISVTSAAVLPANATQCELAFTYTPVGTADVADYIEIDEVQVEPSPVMTDFDRRDFAYELLQCKRYCRKSFVYTTAPAQSVGVNTNEIIAPAQQAGANGNLLPVRYDLPLRATPIITLYNPSAANAQVRDETHNADCSATTVANNGPDGFFLTATGNAATTLSCALGFHYFADAEL